MLNIDEHALVIRRALEVIGPELTRKGMATFDEDNFDEGQGYGTCFVARMFGPAYAAQDESRYMYGTTPKFIADKCGVPLDIVYVLSDAHVLEPRLLHEIATKYLAEQGATP